MTPQQTPPVIFILLVLTWTVLCAGFGAYKAFFEHPDEDAE